MRNAERICKVTSQFLRSSYPLLPRLAACILAVFLCTGAVVPLYAQDVGTGNTAGSLPPDPNAGVDSALKALEQAARQQAVLDAIEYIFSTTDGTTYRKNGWLIPGNIDRFEERLDLPDLQVFIDPDYCASQNAEALYELGNIFTDYDNDIIIRFEPSKFDKEISGNKKSVLALWHEMCHAISHGHQEGSLTPSIPFSNWRSGMSTAEEGAVDHLYIEWAENILINGVPALNKFEERLLKLDKKKQPNLTSIRGIQNNWQNFLFSVKTPFDTRGGYRDVPSTSQRAEFTAMTGLHVDKDAAIKGYLAQGYRSEPFGLVATFTDRTVDPATPKHFEFDAKKSTGSFFIDDDKFALYNVWRSALLSSNRKVEKYFWVFDADGKAPMVFETIEKKTTHVYDAYGTYRVVLFVVDEKGYVSSEYEKQVVVEGIDIKLGAIPTSGPAELTVGLQVKLISASHPRNLTIRWDFDGDGKYDESDNDEANFRGQDKATAVYKQPGTYTAKVEAIDSQGNSDIAEVTITVGSGVNGVLNATPKSGPPPLKVDLNSSGSLPGDGASLFDWEWDFNGNGIFNESGNGEDIARGNANTSHTYDVPGTYLVTLRLTDDQSNVGTASTTVTVEADLNALFTISPPSGPSPLVAEFDASSSTYPVGETITYLWDFDAAGKGKPYQSVGNVMTLEYPKDGVYTITLKLRDSQGNESAVCSRQLMVGLLSAPPIAAIKIIDVSTGGTHDAVSAKGMIPLKVKFSAADSTDSDGTVVKYTWHFDDWTAPVVTTTPEVWHEYSLTSIFKPTVIVTDDFGNDSNNNPTVTVHPGIAEPELRIDQTPDSSGGTLATCTLLGTYIDAKTTLTGCRWDFGDNTVYVDTTKGNATHVYAQPGTYTIKVEVSYADTAGGTATVQTQKTVQIGSPVTPKLSVLTAGGAPATNPVPIGTQMVVSAAGSSSAFGAIAKCEFDLDGDGKHETDNGAKLTCAHTFKKAGQTTISVRITDVQGNTATKQLTVNVGVLLTANLTVTPANGPPPLAVTCDASGSTNAAGLVHHYIWEIIQVGGPSTSNEYVNAELLYNFPDPAEYIIRVTACDDLGNQSAPVEKRVIVGEAINAVLGVTPISGVPPLTSQLSAAGSTGVPAITKYEWDLNGDGIYELDTGVVDTTSVTLTTYGDHTVGLQVTDGTGQTATATETISASAPSTLTGWLEVTAYSQYGYTGDHDGAAPCECKFLVYGKTTGAPIVSFAMDYTGNGQFTPHINIGTTTWNGWTHGADMRDYTYTKPGIYDCTLRITDSAGNFIDLVRPVYVD